MPTEAELKQLILVECTCTSDETVQQNIDTWWTLAANSNQLVQYLTAKQSVCRYLLAKYRENVTLRIGGDTINWREKFTNMKDLLDEVTTSLREARGDIGPGELGVSRVKTDATKRRDCREITGGKTPPWPRTY